MDCISVGSTTCNGIPKATNRTNSQGGALTTFTCAIRLKLKEAGPQVNQSIQSIWPRSGSSAVTL